jgi:hypothetical protein
MKLKHVHIENFKGVKNLDIPLTVEPGGTPRRITCLIGDNGSGKTSVLQAIALTLSLATRHIFRWHGFLPERLGTLGNTVVELTVNFDPEEIQLTQTLSRAWSEVKSTKSGSSRGDVEPSDLREVRLRYKDGKISSPEGIKARRQFLGRAFWEWLNRAGAATHRDFPLKPGDVFWFDQYRNLGTVMPRRNQTEMPKRIQTRPTTRRTSWKAGVEHLRESLIKWWTYYISPGEGPAKSYIKDLERMFGALFPGTKFVGTMPRDDGANPGSKDFYFLLNRGGRTYDLAEMASGEQAIFSLLYDFIRFGISRSVVLIDELELHLHPPAQQALYAALPKLGHDCQFFITTHSEFLTGVIPDEHVIRLPGGRPCL